MTPQAVEFTYTLDDYIAAQRLHAAPMRWSWIFLAVCAIAAASFFYVSEPTIPAAAQEFGILSAFAAAAFVLLWFGYIPWSARRTFARQPLAHLPRQMTLLPEGLRTQSDRGDGTLLWRDFIRWRANGEITNLYVSPRIMVHIPNRLAELGFPVTELRETLAREIGPPMR